MSKTLICTRIEAFKPQGYVSAANVNEFLQQLTGKIQASNDCVLLVDMDELEFLDSAGLMALVKGFRLAQSLGRRFSLCSVPPSVRMMFELTQLDTVFEIFENRDSFEATLN
jgi:anti-anti-sigma factor